MAQRRAGIGKRSQQRIELARLFEETVGLYWRLTRIAAAIYGRGPLSGPRRTTLMAFARGEPQTVARLAASRAQDRQRLQPLVNSLIAEGLLEQKENPFHKRSVLVGLTKRGEATVRHILDTEARLRDLLPLTVSRQSLGAAASVLSRVNKMFDEPETLGMLRKEARKRPRPAADTR